MTTMFDKPVTHPSAWRGSDLRQSDEWIAHMTQEHIDEIDAALEIATSSGKPVTELNSADFPLPTMSQSVAKWVHEVNDGRGFVLVRGLPVERYSDLQVRTIFWGLGLYLGTALSQNSYGDLLGDVFDDGAKMGTGKVRGYRTNSFLRFHTDRCDIVGLLCLRKAKSGGMSSIVSSISIHNEILATCPEYLEPLYNGLLYANLEEGGDYSTWRVPVYSVSAQTLSCRLSRNTIESARTMGVAQYTELEVAALEYLDSLAARDDLRLDMDLQRGDMQFINNYTTLHSRTAYEDFDDKALRRHMVRLWIKTNRRRVVSDHYKKEYDGVEKVLERKTSTTHEIGD